ncbi:MAG: hypothetical protein NZ533_03785 [Casimicrobiaceae bacterium]|nr:hypothetical protein [Casimicrobiaceae bacterium]MDW8312584.1 hypothetical protein [Burkholderiales bacterium]
MNTHLGFRFGSWFAAVLGVLAASAVGATSAFVDDPPTRVGRLAELAGEVQIAGASGDWQRAPRNHPVIRGDNVYVAPGGRAEIDLGTVQLWLAEDSALYLEQLNDDGVVLRLGSGALAVRVRAARIPERVRVVLEAGEVAFLRPGFYVLHAATNLSREASVVAVRDGLAELDIAGRRHVVTEGRRIAFDSFGTRWDFVPTREGSFEAWAASRDRRYDRRPARRVEPWDEALIGLLDLDDYGRWDYYAPYGRVWFPTAVPPGWSPYRFGRWIYLRPWGWTWIDDAPWGFAPMHFGRWVRIHGRWAWCPGLYTARPVYAPALVTFFGGDGWQVSISTGPAFGWVPLGWNEPYTPWYSYSPQYWRLINRPYVRNIAEGPWRPAVYVHARIPEAVTLVPMQVFLAGRPVAEHRLPARGVDPASAPPARVHEYLPAGWQPAQPPAAPPIPGVRPSDIPPLLPGSRPRPASEPIFERAPLSPSAPPAEPPIRHDPNPVLHPPMRVRSDVRERTFEAPPASRERPPAPPREAGRAAPPAASFPETRKPLANEPPTRGETANPSAAGRGNLAAPAPGLEPSRERATPAAPNEPERRKPRVEPGGAPALQSL